MKIQNGRIYFEGEPLSQKVSFVVGFLPLGILAWVIFSIIAHPVSIIVAGAGSFFGLAFIGYLFCGGWKTGFLTSFLFCLPMPFVVLIKTFFL